MSGTGVCPPPESGIAKGTPLHSFTLAVVILYPIVIASFVVFFYVNRNVSVFIRKRSFKLLAVSAFGSLSSWGCTVLYDYLGPDQYPCWLFGMLFYFATPLIGAPVLLKGLSYTSKVSIQALRNQTEHVTPEASMRTFISNVRVALCGSRTKQDKLQSAQFSRTPYFWMFWTGFSVLPYVIGYLIRLGTDDRWKSGCFGCHLSDADCITLIAINSLNMTWTCFGYSFKLKKRDSLRIIRECMIGIVAPMPALLISYTLALIDPGNTYANGGFSWASLTLSAAAVSIYIQSVHQVFVANAIKRKILFSDNVDRLDRFEDVMKDKELKASLYSFLQAELSSEILMFLDACNEVKAKFAQDPAAGEAEIRIVYGLYLEKNRAIYEVNLPASIRESVAQRMNGPLDPAIFNEAYNDVRDNLLRDGFPRFLNRLKTNPVVGRKSATVKLKTSLEAIGPAANLI